MGPVSLGRKVINLEEEEEEEVDERAKRRLRRRFMANGFCKPDLCGSTRKKSTECKAVVESLMFDDDYDKCLSRIKKDGWDWVEHRSGHDANGERENVEDSGDRNKQCGVDDGDGGNANVGDGIVNSRSVRDDDMDPQYRIFWDNLREDGNSYVLQIVQEDGGVKEIRYHQDGGSPDEVDLDTMQALGQKKTEFVNTETVENVEEAPERRSLVKKRNLKLEALEPVSDGTHVHSSKRHCLKVSTSPENFGSTQPKEKSETRINSRMVIVKSNLEDCPQKENGPVKKSSMLRKRVKETNTYNLSGRTNGGSNKKSGSKYLQFPEGGCNNEAGSDSDLTDDNYHEFLRCTKNDGKGLVFTSRSCGLLRYDEESSSDPDEESSSDSDVVVLDRDPHEGYRTPITMDVDSRRSTKSHSQFRQGIMQDLKRPYNSEEYISLLENWSRQRPPTGHDKNLRNGVTKSYALEGEFGRSYLEMYKDLAKKIEAVTEDDRPRKLNLLRGFFYWLKNIAQQGSFKPWNDKACLNVLPQKH